MLGTEPQLDRGVTATLEAITVDLGPELRRELAALAGRTGRHQAELIREALALYIERHGPPALPSWVGRAAVGGDAGEATHPTGTGGGPELD